MAKTEETKKIEPRRRMGQRADGSWMLPQPPWLPAEYEIADLTALQALSEGKANPLQQKRALDFIINNCCQTYDIGWHPSGDHEASFAAGRRYVGLQIVKGLKVNTAALLKKAQNAT